MAVVYSAMFEDGMLAVPGRDQDEDEEGSVSQADLRASRYLHLVHPPASGNKHAIPGSGGYIVAAADGRKGR